MTKYIILMAALAVSACATTSPEDAEYRNQEILNAHQLCVATWDAKGWPWVSNGTRSAMDIKLGRQPKPIDALREIKDNGCYRYVRAMGYNL